jgi:hypothetical protein
MRQREFNALLGGAAAAWTFPVRAQQPALPVIALVNARSANAGASTQPHSAKGLAKPAMSKVPKSLDDNWVHGSSQTFVVSCHP